MKIKEEEKPSAIEELYDSGFLKLETPENINDDYVFMIKKLR